MGWDYRGGGFMNGYPGQGPSALGIILMIVFWALVALVVVMVVQHMRHDPHHLHHYGAGPHAGPDATLTRDPSIDILKERFARGDVSEEEYTRRLALLKDK